MFHARETGCTRFEFGRSKLGTGPFSYKKNWGFEPRPLVYARWLAPGETPRDTNPNSARYRLQVALWKRLPLWAANRIGTLIDRGLDRTGDVEGKSGAERVELGGRRIIQQKNKTMSS